MERIRKLRELILIQHVRQGGSQAEKTAMSWSRILTGRERGESLTRITQDPEKSSGPLKTYAKLARRALKDVGIEPQTRWSSPTGGKD